MNYYDLRQKLSDSVYPYVINEIQRVGIGDYDMDGNFYNPDGSRLTPSNQLGVMTQTIAFFFPSLQEHFAVVISPHAESAATVNVLTPLKAARHTVIVSELDFAQSLQAVQEAITTVLQDIGPSGEVFRR